MTRYENVHSDKAEFTLYFFLLWCVDHLGFSNYDICSLYDKKCLWNVFIFKSLCIFSIIWFLECFLIFIFSILNSKNLAILLKKNWKHEMSVHTHTHIFNCIAHVYIRLWLNDYIVNILINCDWMDEWIDNISLSIY